uniref:Uncharacterized protein n=1 Tax=Parastrongyloides trichosuri TaxID=131310 RepID=A0A0N4ZC26_PARTI
MTHAKFVKQCSNGNCVYKLPVPGLSNQLIKEMTDEIGKEEIFEATEETITNEEENFIDQSIANLLLELENLENEFNNVSVEYQNIVLSVQKIEENLQKTNTSMYSIEQYIDYMNQTLENNSNYKTYQCYINAYEQCGNQTTTVAPLTTTTSSSESTATQSGASSVTGETTQSHYTDDFTIDSVTGSESIGTKGTGATESIESTTMSSNVSESVTETSDLTTTTTL